MNARDLNEPLDEYIDRRTAGLVHPSHQSTLIVVDGLDEKGVSQANELIIQIQYYVNARPKSRFVATSRPLPGLQLPNQQIHIPPLDDEGIVELVGRIAGTTLQLRDLYSWTDSVRLAARRPLFAVMIGAELRQRPTMCFDRPLDLINRLAQQVVERSRREGERVNELLQKLAVRAIASGRRVPKSAITYSYAEHRLLADSGLVDATGTTVDFNHEVLREWYAARALIEENLSVDDVVPGSDRWMTAFKLVLDSDNWNARRALRYKLASSDPGLASLLIEETSRRRGEDNAADEVSEPAGCIGGDLWKAMDSWRRGLGGLFQVIGPVGADGETAPVGVHESSVAITTSWYQGTMTLPRVVRWSRHPSSGPYLDRGWVRFCTETKPLNREWPWVATRRYLVGALSKTIMGRGLALPNDDAVRELAWAFALRLRGQSEFDPRPISVRDVVESVRQISHHATQATIGFRIRRLEVTPDELKLVGGALEDLLEEGAAVVGDPWPSWDQRPSDDVRELHTWDFYSPDRVLERTRAVYSAALKLYAEMIDRWFGGFRARLRFGRLLPVRLEGRLRTSVARHWKGAPSLRWRAGALPEGETSQVTVEWSPTEEGALDDGDLLSYWREEERNLKAIRPGADATPCPIRGEFLPSIGSVRPVTDLVHSWLVEDLRELGWTDLSRSAFR